MPHTTWPQATLLVVFLALNNQSATVRAVPSPQISDNESFSALWPLADGLGAKFPERPSLASLFSIIHLGMAHWHVGRFSEITVTFSAVVTHAVPVDSFRHGAFSGFASGDGISVVVCGTGGGVGVGAMRAAHPETANAKTKTAILIPRHSLCSFYATSQ